MYRSLLISPPFLFCGRKRTMFGVGRTPFSFWRIRQKRSGTTGEQRIRAHGGTVKKRSANSASNEPRLKVGCNGTFLPVNEVSDFKIWQTQHGKLSRTSSYTATEGDPALQGQTTELFSTSQ